MPDYTHKRYLVRNNRTGETRTVTKRIGSNRYDGGLAHYEEVIACIGGFRKTNDEEV